MIDPTPSSQASTIPLGSTARFVPAVVWGAGLGLVLSSLSGLYLGRVGVEKMLTSLMFPIQATWLLLSGWLLHTLYESLRSKLPKSSCLAPLGLWSLFTICGSPGLGDACYRYLETREELFRPDTDPPLDWLVVLGGGTNQGPTRAEAAESGDRVLLAAQLFTSGRTQRLITTGSHVLGERAGRSTPADQTSEIWTALGIPLSCIDTLPGINTLAEMQALSEKIRVRAQESPQSNSSPLRIGILTSAWHLPRAMRLARAAGLSGLIPVAADHKMRVEPHNLWDYLPSASGFLRLERCQKEFMAGLVGR